MNLILFQEGLSSNLQMSSFHSFLGCKFGRVDHVKFLTPYRKVGRSISVGSLLKIQSSFLDFSMKFVNWRTFLLNPLYSSKFQQHDLPQPNHATTVKRLSIIYFFVIVSFIHNLVITVSTQKTFSTLLK